MKKAKTTTCMNSSACTTDKPIGSKDPKYLDMMEVHFYPKKD
jgi:hypothetical protein